MKEEITYDKYIEAALTVYKYLIDKYGSYVDLEDMQRNNAEIGLLVALAHPYLYLDEKLSNLQ